MNNPNGPYPGRQLFTGLTVENKPCFAYLVTGRSAASRERIATPLENGVRIGPLGGLQYDPLRHYSAVKYSRSSGILAVSNGIQTEAIFEMYQLLFNTSGKPGKEYLESILEGAGAEPDPPINTPRIAGVITRSSGGEPVFIIGIKASGKAARAWQNPATPGKIFGVAVYRGDMDSPQATDPDSTPSQIEFKEKSPRELAELLFDISGATSKGSDIRVCSVGGVRSENRQWEIFIKNVHAI